MSIHNISISTTPSLVYNNSPLACDIIPIPQPLMASLTGPTSGYQNSTPLLYTITLDNPAVIDIIINLSSDDPNDIFQDGAGDPITTVTINSGNTIATFYLVPGV